MAQYTAYDWAWTINAPSTLNEEEQKQWLLTIVDLDLEPLAESDDVAYICWKGERVSNGHIQGFVQFIRKYTLSQVRSLIGKTVHCEKINSPPLANKRYVQKEESSWAPILFTDYGEFIEEWRDRRKSEVKETHYRQRLPQCYPHKFVPHWDARLTSRYVICFRCDMCLPHCENDIQYLTERFDDW